MLDVQTGKVPVDAEGFPKHVIIKRNSDRKAEMSNTKLKSVDVVVVGSGVVGSIMSMELASAGLSVVCLERGKQFDVNTDF